MKNFDADIVIVGAGPVGLMCAYLSHLCGLKAIVIDKSEQPLQFGRADALNARTLQLLEISNLFNDLYPLGKPCNTSSVWANGKFISRQSKWWDDLEGCLHKHFLMLGQSFVEGLLDQKLDELGQPVRRCSEVQDIQVNQQGCKVQLASGEVLTSRFLIGADGSRSLVRNTFNIPFEITRPQIVWAVIDAVIETDFPKVPEIIVFQAETSDVAWIPREGKIDRFYVRMDSKDFTIEEATAKINKAMSPHSLKFTDVVWFSQFSVKESVAESFFVHDRVFLAGDACHIHSVNGGQGLNTGLADAYNLIWKLHRVIKHQAPLSLLDTYEAERKPVALSVIETSGELVRTTKFSKTGSHAQDYVKIVEKRAGNVTGMGIRYGQKGLAGSRLFDFEIQQMSDNKDKSTSEAKQSRIYSLLDYSKFTLVLFGEQKPKVDFPKELQVIHIAPSETEGALWTKSRHYSEQALLVRPDSYIQAVAPLDDIESIIREFSEN
jgi:2-polyprenyl-6-methoxyphenol hydroxylase-like FAD-dependent oxidoreductase